MTGHSDSGFYIGMRTSEQLDAVIGHLYVRTLATLRLGPIARKLIGMAYQAVHSGAHGLISRVVPTLTDQELRDASAFCAGLVIAGDAAVDSATGTGRRRSRAPA